MEIQDILKNASPTQLAEKGIFLGEKPVFHANDAALLTAPNVGVPIQFLNYLDPQSVKLLVTPMRGEETLGAMQYGDWKTTTYQFAFEEPVGSVASYGDFNNNGTTESNYNWIPRQSFHFQTHLEVGDRDIDRHASASIDRVGNLRYAAMLILEKFRNASYYYGINGLINYGLLNDPNLNPTIQPTTKAAGGTAWDNATKNEIYKDFLKLFSELQEKSGGLIQMSDAMTLTLSPSRYTYLMQTDDYASMNNVLNLIKGVFSNMRIVQAVEMDTEAGEQMTLIADQIQGTGVAAAGYTERLRNHRMVMDTSSMKQKLSAGTWGAIIKQPVGIASMLGI